MDNSTDFNLPSQNSTGAKRRRPGRPRLDAPSSEYIARRTEIITAAADIFRAKGYEAGTLDDVAEVLDMRRAAVYYYIKSKQHLLYLVIDRALEVALKDLEGYADLRPAERLEMFIRHQVRIITFEPNMFVVYFDHSIRLDEKYKEKIRVRERRYFKAIMDIVTDAIESRVLRDVDPLYATRCILGMTTWPYKWFNPQRDEADKLADTCVSLVFAALNGKFDS